MVDAEPAQRGVERAPQVAAGEADVVGPVPGREAALGGEHDPVADVGRAGRQPAADDLLRGAAGVDVGGVDEGAAGLDERVELRVRALLVGLVAERHRAERVARHDGSRCRRGCGTPWSSPLAARSGTAS